MRMKHRVAKPLAKMVVDTWKPVTKRHGNGGREHDDNLLDCVEQQLDKARPLLRQVPHRAVGLFHVGPHPFLLVSCDTPSSQTGAGETSRA